MEPAGNIHLSKGVPPKNSVAFSPHANYTDRATAALSAKLVPTFADRGCHVVSATDPYGR
jgi:hypothetical protein